MICSFNNSKKYEEDFKIANNISSKLGFHLNNWTIDNKGTKLSKKESLICSLYSKLGLINGFRSPNKFLYKPNFRFSGSGGENLRGYPGETIKEYIEKNSRSFKKKYYNSSVRIFKRSISLLKKKKTYYNDYEVSADIYLKGRTRHLFGKTAVEAFLGNEYMLNPLIDPDIMQVKYDITSSLNHDLIAYIYARMEYNLIYFPFDSNKKINKESISKAYKLNNEFGAYEIKSNYNKHFYIDIKRKLPLSLSLNSKNDKNIDEYLKDYFNNSIFINIFNKVYDDNIYYNIKKINSSFYKIGLFAVAKIIEDLSFNNKNFNQCI